MSKAKKGTKWLHGFTTFSLLRSVRHEHSSHERGFTLVELLVVISILAILAIVGIVVFSNITGNARDSKRKADIQAIAKTMEVNYNPASGYQIDGSNFASQLLPIPPRDEDYQIYYGENNQSFLTCAKLEKATESFCLRSTQGSDVYPDPNANGTKVILISSSGTLSTPVSVSVSEVIPAANGSASPTASTTVTETTPDITTGLVGYWKMDENSGTSTYDLSENGYTGTLTNGPTWIKGKYGSGISFDGINDYVDLGDNTALRPGTAPITVSFWMNTRSTDRSRVISSYHGGDGIGYEFIMLNSGINHAVYFINGAVNDTIAFDTPINDGDWHHIVFLRDGSNIRVFIDKIQQGTTTDRAINVNGTANLNIGRSPASTNYYAGSIDEVRIYNRALLPDEISQL